MLYDVAGLLRECFDKDEVTPTLTTISLTKEAQLAFSKAYQKNRAAVDKALGRFGPKFKYINWDKAKERKISLSNAVVAPVVFENDLYQSFGNNKHRSSLKGNTFLYMYKDAAGNMQTEVVRYIADDTYVAGAKTPFSGLVLVEDVAGNLIVGYHFKKIR